MTLLIKLKIILFAPLRALIGTKGLSSAKPLLAPTSPLFY